MGPTTKRHLPPLAARDPGEYWKRVMTIYRGAGAVILGNVLEWYDWTVYGYMEDLIADVFMDGHHTATWLVFAIPFAARPLGSVLLGWVGDTFGRAAGARSGRFREDSLWLMSSSTRSSCQFGL